MAEIADLVARGATLKREIKAKQEALKDIEAVITKEFGKGTYEASGAKCIVVPAGTTFTVKDEDRDAVKKAAGTSFKKLFNVSTTWAPAKSFKDLVGAVLKPGAAKKLLELVTTTRAGFVKWEV